MWKLCKSNHRQSGETTSGLCNSSLQEIPPKSDGLFDSKVPYISSQSAGCVHEARFMCAELSQRALKWRKCTQCRISSCTHSWNDTCCTYSDFVKWISAFSCKTNLCWPVMLDKYLLSKRLKVRKKGLVGEAGEREGRAWGQQAWQQGKVRRAKAEDERGGNERMTEEADEPEKEAVELIGSTGEMERWVWLNKWEIWGWQGPRSKSERLPWEAKDVVEGEDSSALLLAIPGVIFPSHCWLVPEHISRGEN